MGLKRVLPGVVLYNGERPFDVRGVRVLNPLHIKDIWETLTESFQKSKVLIDAAGLERLVSDLTAVSAVW